MEPRTIQGFVLIDAPFDSKINAEVYRNKTMEIESKESKNFMIMLSVQDGSEPGVENVTVTAESTMDAKYGLNVEVSEELVVKVLEKDKEKARGGYTDTVYFILLIVIIILIIILLIFLFLKRGEKDLINGYQEEEKEIEE